MIISANFRCAFAVRLIRHSAIKKINLQCFSASLNALSPLAVMQRGYAVAKESGGKIIKSVSQISANDDVKIEFADGNAVCKVCEVNQIER